MKRSSASKIGAYSNSALVSGDCTSLIGRVRVTSCDRRASRIAASRSGNEPASTPSTNRLRTGAISTIGNIGRSSFSTDRSAVRRRCERSGSGHRRREATPAPVRHRRRSLREASRRWRDRVPARAPGCRKFRAVRARPVAAAMKKRDTVLARLARSSRCSLTAPKCASTTSPMRNRSSVRYCCNSSRAT